ncbi:MAG: cache domain-containing protein, partial [Firmicutes bacterium]|nr:cache domain-containing protein [Bacillota bacterium]
MNKKLNSIKNKTVFLIVIMLLLSVVIFTVITQYQNRILIRIVGEARTEQQQAISDTSEQTIHKVIVDTLSGYSTLQAKIADKDFSEIVADISTLQTMAQSLIEKRPHITAAELRLPDPALDGTPSAMVLCEEGVNYRNSKYLKVIGHMSGPMTGIVKNSDKISACYIGLADGTYFGVESDSANKYDENGKLIPLAVRQRPWYTGAVESGGIHFTGIEKEAFSGRLIVMCSAPVVANGKTVGVVGIDIVLDSMCDFINGTADGTGFAFIVNENGQVIIEPENTEFFEITTADSAKDLRKSDNKEFGAFISEALSEQTDIKLLSVDGKEYYVAGCPMPTVGWTVITMVDKEATELPERTILAEYNRINEEASEKFAKDSFASKLAAQLVILVLFIAGIYLARRAAGRIAN